MVGRVVPLRWPSDLPRVDDVDGAPQVLVERLVDAVGVDRRQVVGDGGPESYAVLFHGPQLPERDRSDEHPECFRRRGRSLVGV